MENRTVPRASSPCRVARTAKMAVLRVIRRIRALDGAGDGPCDGPKRLGAGGIRLLAEPAVAIGMAVGGAAVNRLVLPRDRTQRDSGNTGLEVLGLSAVEDDAREASADLRQVLHRLLNQLPLLAAADGQDNAIRGGARRRRFDGA